MLLQYLAHLRLQVLRPLVQGSQFALDGVETETHGPVQVRQHLLENHETNNHSTTCANSSSNAAITTAATQHIGGFGDNALYKSTFYLLTYYRDITTTTTATY